MNLIQVAERLKSLPLNDPRVDQMLTAYANGMNPQVPPYVALGELNRRKQLQEKAKADAAGQPPEQSVKDQITQNTGIMALQQGRQQEAMQKMAQGMAQQGGGIPQPVAKMAPVQGQQEPRPQQMVQAARGGLLAAIMRQVKPRRMASGGIISFQSAGSVDDRIREMSEAQDAAYAGEDEEEVRRRRLMEEAARFRQTRPTFESMDPIAARKAAIAADPSLAIADKDTGAELLKRLDEMQALRRAELQKQREEATQARPGILSLLGQAAAASRGQYGRSALASILGGYSGLEQKQREAGLAQEQGLRVKELELQQARMEAQNKLEEAQRARAEGRIDDYRKAMMDYQKIVKDYDVASAGLLRGEISAVESAATRKQTERIRAESAAEKARIAAGKPGRVTDLQGDVNAEYAKIKADNPEMSDVDAMAQARKIARERQQQTQSRGVDVRAQEAAQRSQDAAIKAATRAATFNDPIFQRYLKEASGDKAAATIAYVRDYMAGKIAEPTAPGAKPAAAAAPQTGQYKVGETKIVQSGPNKGKTAVWDGVGWKLKE